MNIGTLIRRFRKERHMTLKAVAEKARVSEGFMSQVENNVKSPSVETLVHICEALGLNIGDLLNQARNQERLFLIRRTEWDEVDLPHTGFATRRFCAPDDRTVLDSAVLFLEPGRSIPVRKDIKNGQEILSVLKGGLELVHGERVVHLTEGDTVHFWTDPVRQNITNTGPVVAIVLWVGTI